MGVKKLTTKNAKIGFLPCDWYPTPTWREDSPGVSQSCFMAHPSPQVPRRYSHFQCRIGRMDTWIYRIVVSHAKKSLETRCSPRGLTPRKIWIGRTYSPKRRAVSYLDSFPAYTAGHSNHLTLLKSELSALILHFVERTNS